VLLRHQFKSALAATLLPLVLPPLSPSAEAQSLPNASASRLAFMHEGVLAAHLKLSDKSFWNSVSGKFLQGDLSPIEIVLQELHFSEQLLPPLSFTDSEFNFYGNSFFATAFRKSISSEDCHQEIRKNIIAALSEQSSTTGVKDLLTLIKLAEDNKVDWLNTPARNLLDRTGYAVSPVTACLGVLSDLTEHELQYLASEHTQDLPFERKLKSILSKRFCEDFNTRTLFSDTDSQSRSQYLWRMIAVQAAESHDAQLRGMSAKISQALDLEIFRIERFSYRALQKLVRSKELFLTTTNSSESFTLNFICASDHNGAFSYNTVESQSPLGLLSAALSAKGVNPVYFEVANDQDFVKAIDRCLKCPNIGQVRFVEFAGHGSKHGNELSWTEEDDNQQGFLSLTIKERPSVLGRMDRLFHATRDKLEALVLSSCSSYISEKRTSLSSSFSGRFGINVIALQKPGLIPIRFRENSTSELELSGHTYFDCKTVVLKNGSAIKFIAAENKNLAEQ
jgi:hypothetical protein